MPSLLLVSKESFRLMLTRLNYNLIVDPIARLCGCLFLQNRTGSNPLYKIAAESYTTLCSLLDLKLREGMTRSCYYTPKNSNRSVCTSLPMPGRLQSIASYNLSIGCVTSLLNILSQSTPKLNSVGNEEA